MINNTVAQRREFNGVKISDSLSLSPMLLPAVEQMLPVGKEDVVIATARGVLRTVGDKIYTLSIEKPLAGGVVTNPCGDVVVVQKDGDVCLIDRVGTRDVFTLPRQPSAYSPDGEHEFSPLSGPVCVATDITGEQIAVAYDANLYVFNRRGVTIARYELSGAPVAVAVSGSGVLVAERTGAFDLDVVVNRYTSGGMHYVGIVEAQGVVSSDFDGTNLPIVKFSADATTVAVLAQGADEITHRMHPRIFVARVEDSQGQFTLSNPHALDLDGVPSMSNHHLTVSPDGTRVFVVGHEDGDSCRIQIGWLGSYEEIGVIKECVGEGEFATILGNGREVTLGHESDRAPWRIKRESVLG